jgi:hypothetical protein
LRNALIDGLLHHRETLEESRLDLKGWLDNQVAVFDKAYGEYLKDPAMTALYTEEFLEIVRNWKQRVDRMIDDAVQKAKKRGA